MLEPKVDNKYKRCFNGRVSFPSRPVPDLVSTLILIKAVMFDVH